MEKMWEKLTVLFRCNFLNYNQAIWKIKSFGNCAKEIFNFLILMLKIKNVLAIDISILFL